MCGFSGFLSLDGHKLVEQPRIGETLGALRHRGPDGSGHFLNEDQGIFLAHTRLAIIDVTEQASQPMRSRSGNHVIVFNGEIYNYKYLFERYCPKDGTVNGNSDTAVLLHLFEKFGKDSLELLDGMFAFAIYSIQTRTIFLARDRFGEKPLYLKIADEMVAFGSELKAIRAMLPNSQWKVDPIAQFLFLVLGSVPAPHSIYRGIVALRPGSWISIESSGRISEGRYWNLTPPSSANSVAPTYDEAVAQTRELLTRAVESRLVSDVPVGLFLSGGFDSASILSVAQCLGRAPATLLCIDFVESGYSEYEVASATAQHFGCGLERRMVRAGDFLDQATKFFESMDQPTADGLNTYLVSRIAKDLGLKVWLSGVGGDELFGGYPSFNRIGRLSRLGVLAQLLVSRSMLEPLVDVLGNHLKLSKLVHLADPGNRALRAYQSVRCPIPRRNAMRLLPFSERFETENALRIHDAIYPRLNDSEDHFQMTTKLESLVYMSYQLLRDMDNFSMAHSIELRAPFLDHNLFAYVYSLPERLKRLDRRTKPLLADSLTRSLPKVTQTQPKRGFTFPIDNWLRRELRADFERTVLCESNSSALNIQAVQGIWNAFLAGKIHYTVPWEIYAFTKWNRINCQ